MFHSTFTQNGKQQKGETKSYMYTKYVWFDVCTRLAEPLNLISKGKAARFRQIPINPNKIFITTYTHTNCMYYIKRVYRKRITHQPAIFTPFWQPNTLFACIHAVYIRIQHLLEMGFLASVDCIEQVFSCVLPFLRREKLKPVNLDISYV